jgi:hypothetical protein
MDRVVQVSETRDQRLDFSLGGKREDVGNTREIA